MNHTLHYCFTLTTMLNTLCTLQNITFTNYKYNSLHGNQPIGWPQTPCFSYLHPKTYLCPPRFTLQPHAPSLFVLSPPPSILVQPLPTWSHLLPPIHPTSPCQRPFLLFTGLLISWFSIIFSSLLFSSLLVLSRLLFSLLSSSLLFSSLLFSCIASSRLV